MENTIERVYKSSLKFLDPLSPMKTYETIVGEAINLVNGEDGLIVLKEKSKLKNVYGSSQDASAVRVRSNGFTYTSYKEKKAFVITRKEFEKVHPDIVESGVKSSIFLPLSYKNKSIGVLIIRSRANIDFSQKELEILKLFGSMASLAIRKTQLYSEMKSALDLRDSFMSLASHELRTPLTVINGYAQMLYNLHKNNDSIESGWVKKLYSENIRLINLVKEILEVNRIRSGQVQYFWVESNIIDIINDSLRRFRLQYPQRVVSFTNNLSNGFIHIIGDKEKLILMLISILDNAAKFSSPESVISFEVKEKNYYYYISIKDKGSGITQESLKKIFESFYKGEIHKEGIGVGLYLAKSIVDKHHGTIKISSKKNKGTNVLIKLPIPKK